MYPYSINSSSGELDSTVPLLETPGYAGGPGVMFVALTTLTPLTILTALTPLAIQLMESPFALSSQDDELLL